MPSAIAMLFAAHRDRDALRIDAAMRHLESLDWRERMAPRITEAEAVRTGFNMPPDIGEPKATAPQRNAKSDDPMKGGSQI